MLYSKLGHSDINVSRVCLGSMTWGKQNNLQEGHQQIDYALEQGVNFIDTAELYAVPPSADTYGKTEEIIGHWLANNKQKRQDLILASKIAGVGLPWIRDGQAITGQTVQQAIDESLVRLQTDYIDVFQLHWPNRTSPHFSKHWPNQVRFSETDSQQQKAGMLDILQGLQKAIEAGKIRYCGLSDDTPWGIQTYLNLAEQHSLPKMVSIQNEFSLLHSKDWPYLVEQCVHEQIAFLPWSPLAAGALTGKYLKGARPEGSRWSFSQRNGLFRDTQLTEKAVAAYVAIAKDNNMSPAQLALAWCNQVDGVTSTIIGATNLQQLEENIQAFNLRLTKTQLADINAVQKQFPATY